MSYYSVWQGLSRRRLAAKVIGAVRAVKKKTEQDRSAQGQRKGALQEARFFQAMKEGGWPAWCRGIRLATRDEDQRGIDAVVQTTDVGKLFVQIKSSELGLMRHYRRRHRSPVAIVVIESQDSDESIRHKVFDSVRQLRERFLELRGGAQ